MKQKFPEAITIILIIMVVFMALTWIIPAGEFQYEVVNGRNYLIPGSFRFTEISPQGPASFLMAPIKGFVQAGLIIGFCFLVGGSFGILNKTGAIDAGLFEMLRRTSGKKSSRKMVIVLMMLIFSVCGATFGMSESVLVFIMITIPMARAMGYDSITGLSVSFLAAGVGFAGALTNPFTIGIAQGIAGLPIFSGWEYRLLVWLVFTTATIVFVLVYIRKIEKDPSKSPVYELDAQAESSSVKQDEIPFNFSRKVVVILLFLVLGLIIYGSNRWKWYINEISAVFLALGILSAAVARLKTSEAVKAFVSGAKDMVMAALVIGMARGLLVIAEDGKIIGTMLHYISQYAKQFHTVMAVEMMFVFQGFLNFFVPSGSGQAALTMPIMAPLSDLVGISRQTAVLCFQFGDGIFNMIIPTSGVTMGALSIAGVPYNKWAKWLAPLILIITILAMLLLIPPVLFFNY